ncbi:ribosome-associated heat shock protein Hsp15 [Reinekea marina]|uniref:Heat shock protein 15 n=1 Tax=Reinekea marina TaxID=1310421 RepID=A0ABV7WVK1_9GAMM|nr:ribosome-associated heat shock protein Hsp15 [Reinekea marina]MDN3647415.1 ribosome-associated heat shock protein Hsp15 [Reinekea marina]
MSDAKPNVRLDKWLWAARFYKTRALAKAAIEGGKVHYDGAKSKPSRVVELGKEVRLKLGWDEKTVIVDAISEQRRGAPEAQLLYTETPESITKREALAVQRKAMNVGKVLSDHRPNKKERRQIHRFKTKSTE